MAKYANFELDELVHSDTARAKGIDNTPSFDVVDNLNELVATILQPLRTAWGSGVNVTSGFRCLELNNSLSGASDTSAHLLGLAADLQPANGKFDEFVNFTVSWVKDNRIKFDQILIEKNSKGSRWLHIGLRSHKGQQRGQIKVLEVK